MRRTTSGYLIWKHYCSGCTQADASDLNHAPKGEEYIAQYLDCYDKRYNLQHHLNQRAEKLGMKLVANEQPVKFLLLVVGVLILIS